MPPQKTQSFKAAIIQITTVPLRFCGGFLRTLFLLTQGYADGYCYFPARADSRTSLTRCCIVTPNRYSLKATDESYSDCYAFFNIFLLYAIAAENASLFTYFSTVFFAILSGRCVFSSARGISRPKQR